MLGLAWAGREAAATTTGPRLVKGPCFSNPGRVKTRDKPRSILWGKSIGMVSQFQTCASNAIQITITQSAQLDRSSPRFSKGQGHGSLASQTFFRMPMFKAGWNPLPTRDLRASPVQRDQLPFLQGEGGVCVFREGSRTVGTVD